MTEFEKVLSNLSYTNKDFNAIYNELLDITSKVSYKWNPIESNESDPGVVLLKELALIMDKGNYNIDKNILENFPLSVTQIANARKLFKQLAYQMKWYRSAHGDAVIRYIGEDTSVSNVTLPRFTMLTNDGSSIVYTIVPGTNSHGDVQIPTNGSDINVSVMEGINETYMINKSHRIRVSDLDSNNRIYFNYSNVAENGIFICFSDDYDAGVERYDSWERVNNLATIEFNRCVYEFGVDADSGRCYLEFPVDSPAVFKGGITIRYIRSTGENGNISLGELSALYENITSNNIVLDTSTIQVSNPSPILNGFNPESIDEAWRSYKKVKNTFDSLVTLRDYNNAINTSGLISNGLVMDRSNDIQCCYDVMVFNNGANKRISGNQKEPAESKMSAFDLKLYLLQYVESVNNGEDYSNTFRILTNYRDSAEINSVIESISDERCIQHDFSNIEKDRICMIENRYPINVTIIPQYRVTTEQAYSIMTNAISALYKKLNSKEVEFGEEVVYDTIYDLITNSDSRIKAIALDPIEYETYADYIDSETNSVNHVKISGNMEDVEQVDGIVSITAESVGDDTKHYFYVDDDGWNFVTASKVIDDNGSSVKIEKDYKSSFQFEIFAKCILRGVTPLYVKDTESACDFEHAVLDKIENAETITTNTLIRVKSESDDNGLITSPATEKLIQNEHIRLYAPSYRDGTSYSTYVKTMWYLSTDIEKDSVYTLNDSEAVAFFWKKDKDADLYSYAVYRGGSVLCPTFTMSTDVNTTEALTIGNSNKRYSEGVTSTELTNTLSSMYDTDHVLSSSKSITIKEKNSVTLSSSDGFEFLWILNSGLQMFTNVQPGEFEDRLLEEGEIFIKKSPVGGVEFFEQGTQIRFINNNINGQMSWTMREQAGAIDIENEADKSKSSDKFVQLPDGCSVEVSEMSVISLSEGDSIKLDKYTWSNGEAVSEIDGRYSGVSKYTAITGIHQSPSDGLSYIKPAVGKVVINKVYDDAYMWQEDENYIPDRYTTIGGTGLWSSGSEYQIDITPQNPSPNMNSRMPTNKESLDGVVEEGIEYTYVKPGNGLESSKIAVINRKFSSSDETWVSDVNYLNDLNISDTYNFLPYVVMWARDFRYIPLGYMDDSNLSDIIGTPTYENGSYNFLSTGEFACGVEYDYNSNTIASFTYDDIRTPDASIRKYLNMTYRSKYLKHVYEKSTDENNIAIGAEVFYAHPQIKDINFVIDSSNNSIYQSDPQIVRSAEECEFHVYFPNISIATNGERGVSYSGYRVYYHDNGNGTYSIINQDTVKNYDSIVTVGDDKNSPLDGGALIESDSVTHAIKFNLNNKYMWLSEPFADTSYGTPISGKGASPNGVIDPSTTLHVFNRGYSTAKVWQPYGEADILADNPPAFSYDATGNPPKALDEISVSTTVDGVETEVLKYFTVSDDNELEWNGNVVVTEEYVIYGKYLWHRLKNNVTSLPSMASSVDMTNNSNWVHGDTSRDWCIVIVDANGDEVPASSISVFNGNLNIYTNVPSDASSFAYYTGNGTSYSGDDGIVSISEVDVAKSWKAVKVGNGISDLVTNPYTVESWVRSVEYTSKSWTATRASVPYKFIAVPEVVDVLIKNDGIYEVTSDGEEKINNFGNYSVSVRYSDSTNEDFIEVPYLNSDSAWKARSYLEFDSSKSKYFNLHEMHNQSITVHDRDGNDSIISVDSIIGSETDNNDDYYISGADNIISLTSSEELSTIGGKDISVVQIDYNANKIYPSFNVYGIVKNPLVIGVPVELDSDNDYTAEYGVSLLDEDYIISVSVIADASVSIGIKDIDDTDDTMTYLMTANGDSTIGVGRSVVFIPKDIALSAKSIVIKSAENMSTSVVFDAVYTYAHNENLSDGNSKIVEKIVTDLGYDKGFDYMYTVDEDEEIQNPLIARTFFNQSHPYNKSTICKMTIDRDGISVSNKVK